MKKLLTILAVLFCLSASAQTTVYDTTVVRTPLTVSIGAGSIYDTLYMPAATTSVNGYMTSAAMTNIANLQSDMTTANSNISTLQSTVAGLGGSVASNTQTGTTYTLLESDNNKQVIMTNTGAITVTLPAGLSNGWRCYLSMDGGQVTLAAGAGVTLRSPFSWKRLQTQYGTAIILCRGNNTFTVTGNLKQ